ncbi:metallopeptidase family protein [Parerythrobacter lacustris]|uniref:Metallopeptidase family protein n=1 Tax=Parerythrobacter lacustris TaxID=2969984 RepID=A0ABT1XQX6_9SPHN|nr:metallopeptidase family protein [Parerythrobacter lacustris]MCR2834063.1 metallopeptidase family protein [Parerythrobacter lacustris]
MTTPAARMPTTQDFEQIALETLSALPAHLREQMEDVVLDIREFASPEQLASVGISSQWHLTGLYEGRPIDERSSWESGTLPAMITLFRQPLLREWRETGVEFEALVRHVVIHEAGHHFGFSDEEMHALEDSAGD